MMLPNSLCGLRYPTSSRDGRNNSTEKNSSCRSDGNCKNKKTKGILPFKLKASKRKVLVGGHWWRHSLILSVARYIQHQAGRDITIQLKKVGNVNAPMVKTKTPKVVSPCKLDVSQENAVG